jgi:hypothetical protein
MLRRLRHPLRTLIALAAAILTLGAATGTVLAADHGWFGGSDNAWPYSDTGPAPVLAAVGDIACQPGAPQEGEKTTDTCDQGSGATTRDAAQNATAEQVEAMKPALVAVLGDEQYQNGYYSDFEGSYDKYWGAFKFLQRPAPGNHEFYDNHGQTGVRGLGYFDYFNGIQHSASGAEVDDTVTNPTTGHVVTQPAPQPSGQAGEFGQTGNGWYSYTLGAWHLISLNVECADEPGGCSPTGSWFTAETRWLAQDLQGDHAACTLAYWHQPTFSSTATPPAPGGSCSMPTMPISSSTATTTCTRGLRRWTRAAAPIPPAGSASSSSGPAASRWTPSCRPRPTSRPGPTSTTAR